MQPIAIYDFDRLRHKLGAEKQAPGEAPTIHVPVEPTAPAAKRDFAAMSTADLAGLPTAELSAAELEDAMRAALKLDARELAVQFARQGVRVNALCPGPVETPLLLAIYGDDPAAFARRQVHWPTGRLGKPREIVNAALFLASDESSFVNGAAFVVDGGLTAAYVTPE